MAAFSSDPIPGTSALVPFRLSSTYFMRTESETMATVTPNRTTMVAPIGQSRR